VAIGLLELNQKFDMKLHLQMFFHRRLSAMYDNLEIQPNSQLPNVLDGFGVTACETRGCLWHLL
jgi:hypothetical protein